VNGGSKQGRFSRVGCTACAPGVGQALRQPGDGEIGWRAAVGNVTRQHHCHSAPAPARIKVDPARVATERHREAGPVHVGYQFWQRLELDRILREAGLSATVRRLACAMMLNRLIAPCSEHAMPAWMRRTALGDLLNTDFDTIAEDPLYEVLDKLHPHRATIEAALVARERSLFNLEVTIFLSATRRRGHTGRRLHSGNGNFLMLPTAR
jgi:hypothetical protein